MARRTNELSIDELSLINSAKLVKHTDFKTALSLFIDDCQIRNLRPQTIKYYRNELSVFYKMLKEQNIPPSLDTITNENIG
ncbi:hypothetical protein WKH31_20695 [Metabacillus indicus]|uniref:hypothetical protein n=1 Tax=Metabacillus indicus TaxID=246786 RepID=UPI00317D01B4